ncbi:hypothetical protein [Streptomyces beijiangensis]
MPTSSPRVRIAVGHVLDGGQRYTNPLNESVSESTDLTVLFTEIDRVWDELGAPEDTSPPKTLQAQLPPHAAG